MKYTLCYQGNSITVSSLGAELLSVKICGNERIYQGDGAWKGHAPILFPVCGKCSMIVDGVSYDVGFHGFAKKSEFTLVDQTTDSVSFSLCSDENTLKIYPFEFRFTVKYVLKANGIIVSYSVENTGDKTMWFSIGGHESYLLDQPICNYELYFDEKQNALRYSFSDYLSDSPVESHDGMSYFCLPEKYLAGGNTVIFKNVQAEKVILKSMDNVRVAEIGIKPFSNLLIWQPQGERCVCVEPWSTLPDTKAAATTEFKDKEGVIKIEQGEIKKIDREIKYF